MKTGLKIGGAFSMVIASTLMVACGAGDMNEFDVAEGDALEEGGYSEELGMLEQGIHSCATPDGTNSVMAALAVAAAQDLGRWQGGVDFDVITGDRIALASGTGPDGKPKGKSRCSGSVCKRIEPLLALQYDNATGVYVQAETANTKVLVNPAALRSRMKAKVEEQRTKDAAAKDGQLDLVAKTKHTLTANGSASNLGGCGAHFKFNVVFDASTTTPKPVQAQLKNSLFFADQTNGWVDFREISPGVVAIDPTYGLNDGAVSTAGSCEVACTKISATDISNGCCSCGGVAKTFKKATFNASVFLCQ